MFAHNTNIIASATGQSSVQQLKHIGNSSGTSKAIVQEGHATCGTSKHVLHLPRVPPALLPLGS